MKLSVDRFGRRGESRGRRNAKRQSYSLAGCFHRNQLPPCSLVRQVRPAMARRFAAAREIASRPLGITVKIEPALYSKLVTDKRIAHGAFRLWHYLLGRHGNNPDCWPGLQKICADIGCGKAALLGWIVQLSALGYIKVTSGSRTRSNRYAVLGGANQNQPVVLSRTDGGSTSYPEGGSKRSHELTSVELNSRNQGGPPKLFPKEAKASFESRRQQITNDDASYNGDLYRAGDGSIYKLRKSMKPEARKKIESINREERDYLASLTTS